MPNNQSIINELAEFILRQLNDHNDSPHGVVQHSYTIYAEPQVHAAINCAASYLYAIAPRRFSSIICRKIDATTCIVNTQGVCNKTIDIVSVTSNTRNNRRIDQNNETLLTTPCNQRIAERTNNGRNLMPLLNHTCTSAQDSSAGAGAGAEFSTRYYHRITEHIFEFEKPLPQGFKINILCATYPGLGAINENWLREYQYFITHFALYSLLLADNESRSNIERATLYLNSCNSFLDKKLIVEHAINPQSFIYKNELYDKKSPQNTSAK